MVSHLSIKQRVSDRAANEVCYLRLFTDLHMCANMETHICTHTHAHEMKKVKEKKGRKEEGREKGKVTLLLWLMQWLLIVAIRNSPRRKDTKDARADQHLSSSRWTLSDLSMCTDLGSYISTHGM